MGIRFSRIKVARVMKPMMSMRNEIKVKYRPSTTDSKLWLAVEANVLDRRFSIKVPAVYWVSDLTYISVAEG